MTQDKGESQLPPATPKPLGEGGTASGLPTEAGQAAAHHDKTVKVWDAATGQEVLTLKGHTDRVYSVAFSPDGRRLASGGADRTVKVWDASDPAGSKRKPPTKSATAPTKPAATKPSGAAR